MFKKRQIQKASYDKENQIPILKCSICNGEQVAGFKNIHTGKFEEVMLIRNDRDLEEFKEKYGVEAVGKEY
ncbi:MAG: aspartate dehydrogenase [Lachnospiraceae bacterium]|nr:aspartate dehydrogenase [Lachnospiraceae bacterium]